MKLTKFNFLSNRLVELSIIKNNKKNYNKDTNVSLIKLRKILHVLYKYNMLNKRILLVGTPLSQQTQMEQLLKGTRHAAIPESVWVNGIITNKKSSFQSILKNKNAYDTSKLLLLIKEKYDLILVFSKSMLNLSIIGEIKSTRSPVIFFNVPKSNFSSLTKSCYIVESDFNTLKLLMRAVLKKKILKKD